MQTRVATSMIESLQQATYFKFRENGAAISWRVEKQSTVGLSSTEAEYQAMAAAVQEAIYLRSLINERFWLSDERTNPDW